MKIQDALAETGVLEPGGGITISQAAPGDPVVITSTGAYTDEMARDAIAAALVAGAGVTITPDDPGDTITIAASGGGASDAVDVAYTPTGGVTATDVQAAITELDSEKQPLDTDLTAIAALVSAANKLPYATGSGTWSLADLTAFARTLLDDSDAATARGTLGLGTAAVKNAPASGDAASAETVLGNDSRLAGPRTINAQTGTTYTLALSDADGKKFLTLSNASAITLTVPPNSSVAFPVGTVIALAQLGAGQVTITPGSGVTVNAVPGLKIAAQYGVAELLKVATDTWLAYGRLSA